MQMTLLGKVNSMSEELGKLERPLASQFEGKRILYQVALVYAGAGAPREYTERVDRYWQQVEEQLTGLEMKLGFVKRLYHESVSASGEEGMKLLERLHPPTSRIAQGRTLVGAQLEALEDEEVLTEAVDWERMLMTGFMSQKVARTVSGFFSEASRKRYEVMARRLDETLKPGEAGILFISEGHRVQFPQDIEVFVVSPPALDELRRWLRDHAEALERAARKEAASQDASPSEGLGGPPGV